MTDERDEPVEAGIDQGERPETPVIDPEPPEDDEA